MESWVDIEDFEGFYQVSNLGQVKSVARFAKQWRGGISPIRERILKPTHNHTNHVYVTLCKYGKTKHFFVQVLVAKAFPEICGEWFEGAQVHHKDLDPTNNRADNLIVVSKSEHDAIHKDNPITKERRRNKRLGKKASEETRERIRVGHLGQISHNKKPVYQYTLDGVFIKRWNSATEAANTLKKLSIRISSAHIGSCCTGKRNTHAGFIWRYAD